MVVMWTGRLGSELLVLGGGVVLGRRTNIAIGGELMELPGEFVTTPPADAIMPATCVGYPLFHVANVKNIAQ